MIPLSIDIPMKRLPWANWGLMLATVVISLAVPYIPGEAVSLFPVESNSSTYSPLVLQRNGFVPTQLVTALFQHAGLLHLLGNMLFLFIFGNVINAKLGHLPFLACYFVIGTLVNVLWLRVGEGSVCLGASAAIMGMCGMFLVLYPLNGVQVFWDEFEFTLLMRDWIAEVPGWVVVLLYLAFDIWGALFQRHSSIGYVSHIFGVVLGAGLAVSLLGTGFLKPDPGEQTLLGWLKGEQPVAKDRPRRSRRRKKARSLPLEKEP